MKVKINLITLVTLSLAAFCFILSCGNKSDNITQVGYFKDGSNIRVFTFSYKLNTSEQDIRSHAEKLPYTSNRITQAYYFPEGSNIPADGITLANNFEQVNSVLYENSEVGKWKYSFIRNFDDISKAEFADCEKGDFAYCKK